MNVLILLLKYFVLPILSLVIGVLFVIAIYSFCKKDREHSFVSKFIRGHYFKIKFKLTIAKNSAGNGFVDEENKSSLKTLTRIKIFFYSGYLKFLTQIILLYGGQKESFEILKEDLQDKNKKEINIIIGDQTINIEELAEKLKSDQLQNKDQVIQELAEKLFQLHKQKQKKSAVFSMAGLTLLTIASIIVSLIVTIIMPAIRQSRASITNGTIDSTYKYAWSENIGWINFGTSEGDVHVTDSALTGYAWSKNYGRINLDPSVSGVANDGEGNLSGSAWGENTGLIDFSGVTIDSDGDFNGYADGTVTGQINFNCSNSSSCDNLDYKVTTDWRPQSVRPACNNALDDDGDGLIDYPNDLGCESLTDDNEVNSGGGLPPSAYNPPTPPSATPPTTPETPTEDTAKEGFNILINNGDEHTVNKTVTLKLTAGSDVEKMSISNSADFKGASQIPFQEEIDWELKTPQPPFAKGGNIETVYAKFYTKYGQASDVVSDTIILKAILLESPIIIYPKNNSVVATDEPIFHGTAKSESSITLEILNETASLAKITTITNQWGEWYYYPATPLADGDYQIKVYAQNSAQDVSETVVGNFSVQTSEEPTEQEEPVEPEEPIEPAEPTEPSEPVEPVVEPTEPVEPTEEPTEPVAEPAPPTEPVEPITPQPPLSGGLPTEPSEPVEPVVEPTEPVAEPIEPEEPTESQAQLQETVVIESIHGDIKLTPDLFSTTTPEQGVGREIHGLTNQKVNLFIKPLKPVVEILGQLLLTDPSAKLNKKIHEETLSYEFFDILAPRIALAQEETPVVVHGFKYTDENNDGIYEAQIQLPNNPNSYTLKTLLYYEDDTTKSLYAPILVDPQGYIYEKNDGQETRINGAVVSLYYLNSETKQYEIWDASSYNQKNPQNTNKDGAYSFLVPKGKYYITVQAEGYDSFKTEIFDVGESNPVINFNLALEKEFNWIWVKIISFAIGIITLFVMGWFFKKTKKRDLNLLQQAD